MRKFHATNGVHSRPHFSDRLDAFDFNILAFVLIDIQLPLCVGALTMGAFGGGIWGVAPAYVTPTATRGVGPGLAYHVGAAVASLVPVLMGLMQDRGVPLADVMTIAIAVTLIIAAGMMWLGPEPRGRNFSES